MERFIIYMAMAVAIAVLILILLVEVECPYCDDGSCREHQDLGE